MTLAIFDLDNTLIGGDSDNLWGEFVCEQGLVDSEDFAQRNDQFYADYQAGTLDIDAYLRFALSALKGSPLQHWQAWHRAFMDSKIKPILLPKATTLLADHRQRGHELLIITATNRFITEPIAHAWVWNTWWPVRGRSSTASIPGNPAGCPPITRARSRGSTTG